MEWILVIPIVYLFLVLGLALEAHHMPYIAVNKSLKNNLRAFTVIINYRNEENNLPQLLQSIKLLHYDWNKVQFIAVNDDSSDASLEILQNFKSQHPHIHLELIHRLPTSNSAKKDGITQALHLATHPQIITTDADCILPKDWLLAYNAAYLKYPRAYCVAGPIQIETRKKLSSAMQSHEMVALQMITMGAFHIKRPFMCNGANFSFTKKAFLKVDGYRGNDHISSGDDIFLLEKLWQLNSEHCVYLKNPAATVITYPKDRWKSMVLQRARWAQKGTETHSLLNKVVSFQVLIMSLLFLSLPFLWWNDWVSSNALIMCYALKLLADFLVLFIGKRFFDHKNWLLYFPIQFILYPVIVILISFASLTKSQWHNRSINQSAL
jgi:cellulose synthase/poly-beta-1,6-N-acetylglucosamine synthase-like glycosyltransferase